MHVMWLQDECRFNEPVNYYEVCLVLVYTILCRECPRHIVKNIIVIMLCHCIPRTLPKKVPSLLTDHCTVPPQQANDIIVRLIYTSGPETGTVSTYY